MSKELKRFLKIAGLLKEEDLDLSDTPQFSKDIFKSIFTPLLRQNGIEDNKNYDLFQIDVTSFSVPSSQYKVGTFKGKDIPNVYSKIFDDYIVGDKIEYLKAVTEWHTKEDFPESCIEPSPTGNGLFSLILSGDEVLDIREASVNENDLDLSDTPKFTSMPSASEFIDALDDQDTIDIMPTYKTSEDMAGSDEWPEEATSGKRFLLFTLNSRDYVVYGDSEHIDKGMQFKKGVTVGDFLSNFLEKGIVSRVDGAYWYFKYDFHLFLRELKDWCDKFCDQEFSVGYSSLDQDYFFLESQNDLDLSDTPEFRSLGKSRIQREFEKAGVNVKRPIFVYSAYRLIGDYGMGERSVGEYIDDILNTIDDLESDPDYGDSYGDVELKIVSNPDDINPFDYFVEDDPKDIKLKVLIEGAVEDFIFQGKFKLNRGN